MTSLRIRRHGFAAQHMVVLPTPVRGEATRHALLRQLLVTDAGYFPRAQGHRVERPQGSATHLLLVCLQGRGWVRAKDRITVQPGDVVWLAADQPHSYGADEEAPWTLVWAHFCGEEVLSWQHELGWSSGEAIWKVQVSPGAITDLGLDHVYSCLEKGYAVSNLLEASVALRSTFCALLKAMQGVGVARSAAERTAVVRDLLVREYARPHRLKELATAACLSVPHFSLLFRQMTGYAPIDFLLRQRIKAACHPLDTTRESVATIAQRVGFSDPYYFSRCFRRIMGSSPLAYRRAIKA